MAVSDDDRLRTDVAAILANEKLVKELLWHEEFEGRRPELDPQSVLTAWRALAEDKRIIWRRLYSLDGEPPSLQKDIAKLIGRKPGWVSSTASMIGVELSRTLFYGFPGLPWPILNRLREAGIRSPEELPGRIDELVRKGGWTLYRFNQLEGWLAHNGWPQLRPQLRYLARIELGIHNR